MALGAVCILYSVPTLYSLGSKLIVSVDSHPEQLALSEFGSLKEVMLDYNLSLMRWFLLLQPVLGVCLYVYTYLRTSFKVLTQRWQESQNQALLLFVVPRLKCLQTVSVALWPGCLAQL